MALAFPELQNNRQILEAVSLKYQSYNLFEELMDMEIMQKRVDFIQTVKESMVDMDMEGNEIKYFSSEFLVQKYLHLSDQDIKLNAKLKQEEIEALNLAGDPNNAVDAGESLEDIIPNITEDLKERIKRAVLKKKRKKKKSSDDETQEEE